MTLIGGITQPLMGNKNTREMLLLGMVIGTFTINLIFLTAYQLRAVMTAHFLTSFV
jgi:hypothetical protein